MAILSKEDILACNDDDTLVLDVPEWGGEVRIALMSAADMDAYESSLVTSKGKFNLKNARAKFLAAVLVDADGKKLFTPADITGLGNKSTKVVAKIYKAAQDFNNLTEEELEILIKN